MTNRDPLELPELCRKIAHYLCKADQARCLRVCKVWHVAFVPFLWHSFDIDHSKLALGFKRTPRAVDQIKHSKFIKEVSVQGKSLHYLLHHCPILTQLSITSAIDLSSMTMLHKPALTKLRLHSVQFVDEPGFWKVAATELLHLQVLELSQVNLGTEAMDDFWSICTRLEELQLNLDRIGRGPLPTELFPRLRQLDVSHVDDITQEEMHHWVLRCPQLQSLRLMGQQPGVPNVMISTVNIRDGWPLLDSLDLMATYIPDKDLAAILSGMTRVKRLSVFMTGFGPLSFAALRPHFHGLEILSLPIYNPIDGDERVITSQMTLEVLTSCPKLINFAGGYARAEDLLRDENKDKAWVCDKSMLILFMALVFPEKSDPDQHRAIFKKLSTFYKLRSLDLKLFLEATSGSVTSLEYRLSHGLGQLCHLKNLEDVSIDSSRQNMEKEDVAWMYDNWLRLYGLRGTLNEDPVKNEELQAYSMKRMMERECL
ncbi:hypothetical protein EDD11_001989 [Mortierella claussenii]|nr:hypothetical protein EDD11_001989 [Mortierella claussenii]